jgi:hypothetical protein
MLSERLLQWVQDNLPFFYAGILSIWGGFVQYITQVKNGAKWSWSVLFYELIICSFAGLLAFFACQAASITGWQSALTIAITAHGGTKSMELFRKWQDRLIQK